MLLKSLIVSSALLAGCCAPIPKAPSFDSYLTSSCTQSVLEKPFTSWEDVLAQKAKDRKAFEECSGRHEGLVNSYKNYLREFKATK
jgi:hypothetical protein